MKVPNEKRPTCICGKKMTLIRFRGYYDSFNFWECDICGEEENYEPDKIESGAYA